MQHLIPIVCLIRNTKFLSQRVESFTSFQGIRTYGFKDDRLGCPPVNVTSLYETSHGCTYGRCELERCVKDVGEDHDSGQKKTISHFNSVHIYPNLSACKKVRIVLGNPTCDLDSAVCCLIQGLAEYLEMKKNKLTDHAVIPVLDIPQTEYRLKTEVAYYLDRHKLSSNLLTFRDQIDLKTLTDRISVDIVLVDHHTLAVEDAFLEEFVVKVIDHRPRDSSWPWPGRTICIETVGSCATLVAREFLRNHSDVLDARLSNLLRGPILIDTCNFSTKALRATPVDLEVMESLEKVGGFESDRTQLFEEIAAAKNDIVGLTNDDLMIKDLKITAGVPIVGLPLLVENFLGRENALGAIESFAVSRRARVVLLVGLETKSTEVARDVAVFSSDRDPLADKVTRALTTATEPSLELTASREIFHDEGRRFRLIVYKQGNLRATRKQILPIVRNTVSAECRT